MDDKAGSLDYRGYHVDFYFDDPGQQVYAIFENETISFGSYNDGWEEEMKWIIDEHLDVITRDFGEEFFGTTLRWFDNGGHQDIGLYYKTRLIKVWVSVDRDLVDFKCIQKVKGEADKFLRSLAPYRSRLNLN